MTERERYQATVGHRRPDTLLFHLDFTPDLAQRMRKHLGLLPNIDLAAFLGAFRPVVTSLKRPADYPLPDFSSYFEDIERPEGSYLDANGCLHIPGSQYHFTHRISPLRNAITLRDIETYPWPDYGRYETAHIATEVQRAHAEGRVARVLCTHMYEEAWQVRGYEPFLIDLVTQPEWAHFILDRFKQRNLLAARAAARAEADELYTGDDVANQRTLMFSIEHWREFIKPKWAEVYAAARAIKPDIQIRYHSDGNIEPILDELIEIGVTILNPLQPECLDLHALKKRYGNRIVMDGTIGTQTTLPFGSPDTVRACVRERVETLGQDGALILAPTHVLEPEVPIENILAFVEACREYGTLSRE